ncbi:MAG: DUF4142 domain-containing protein [Nitrospira sp.]
MRKANTGLKNKGHTMGTLRRMLTISMPWMFCLTVTLQAIAAGQLAKSDAAFLKTAAAQQQSEIQLSELAMERSGSEQVKHFAQRMIQDHTKAGQEVNKLLSALGEALADDTPTGIKQPKGKLLTLSGAAFDRAYIRHQIADHQKNVSLFAERSNTLKHPQVREWAFATLPLLKEHVSLAKGLAAKSAPPATK